MTIGREMTQNADSNLETRRRKALFRSWHRGMRENDLILGRFADNRIDTLTATELEQYEALLEVPDADLLKWMTGEKPVPAAYDTELFREISAGRGA
jgi:antitoxin CptB